MKIIGATIILAHSWYPILCCSNHDCFPISENQYKITAEGYVLPSGELLPFGDRRIHYDTEDPTQSHLCTHAGKLDAKAICFWPKPTGV